MMTAPTQSTELMLGEIRGQLREVIHNFNNMNMKVDALTQLVAEQKNLPAEVAKLDVRVTALEAEKNQRQGAMHFGSWLLQTPILGWLAAAAAILWAAMKGKLP